MKKIMACFIAVLMVFSFTACGRNTGKTDDLLEIWAGGQWINEDAANLQKFLNFVNDNYSDELGFKAKLSIKASYEIELDTGLRSNTQGDLLLWDRYQTSQMAEDDVFIGLDDLIMEGGIDKAQFNQPSLDEMTYENKVYGLPLDVDVWGIYINKTVVDDYNRGKADAEKLPYAPETWTQLLDMAQKLSKKDNGTVTRVGLSATDVGQRYHTFLASAKTGQLGSDGRANFNTPAFNDYLNFIRTLKGYGIDRAGYNDRTAFMNGNCAMVYGSGYMGNYFKNYYKDGNYAYAPQPKWDKVGSATAGVAEETSVYGGLLGGFGWVIPKPLESKNRGDAWQKRVDMAFKFASLTAADPVLNRKWVELCGSLPAYKAQWNSEAVNGNATLKTIASIADESAIRPAKPYFPLIDQKAIVANIVKFSNIGGSFSSYNNAQIISQITTDANGLISAF